MKNTKLLPFERNRYYTGKMLTSSDFLTEQLYMNDKRRFVNSMLFGAGIVNGLSVSRLDERTITISGGVALDNQGREIVIPETTVIKLSALEGFENTVSDEICLSVRYCEKKIQPVYAVSKKNNNDDEYEYNRVSEKYEIVVCDKENLITDKEIKPDFLTEKVLADTEEYRLSLRVPSVVSIGRYVKVQLVLEKKTENEAGFSYDALLQFPSFTVENGRHEKSIGIISNVMECGETKTKEIWLKALENNVEPDILIKEENVKCMENGKQVETGGDVLLRLKSDYKSPESLINDSIAKEGLEEREAVKLMNGIVLANILLERNQNTYEIISVKNSKSRRLVMSPADMALRMEYLGYYQPDVSDSTTRIKGNSSDVYKELGNKTENEIKSATGIVEIPVGKTIKKGTVIFSEEIIHGLGKGNVCITLANQGVSQGDFAENFTLFGSKGIFEEQHINDSFETAVKVLNDKGSFIVGARAVKEVACDVVSFRWYASGFNRENGANGVQMAEERRILVETPTVVLEPRESCYFNVRFSNMEATQLAYEMCENNSGTVTMDGLYTAPAREGVFEIKIYCLNAPSVCTYAYAIVKAKN